MEIFAYNFLVPKIMLMIFSRNIIKYKISKNYTNVLRIPEKKQIICKSDSLNPEKIYIYLYIQKYVDDILFLLKNNYNKESQITFCFEKYVDGIFIETINKSNLHIRA